ncbi:hypothetical protein ACFV19_34445 [Streptomyces griseoluteus]|uniref:hypothetical protein n=1 Tax=Streptomyces griseoluteus TaxID=29306 RepID=UPI003675DD9C
MTKVLTTSAVEQNDDAKPDRVARGKPLEFVKGVPVHDSGRAPAFLRTKTQLRPPRDSVRSRTSSPLFTAFRKTCPYWPD